MDCARATAVITCLGAWAGCSFKAPSDAPAPTVDSPGALPACMTDGSYTPNPATGRRYKLHNANTSYDGAIDRCAAEDAHLAVIDDVAEKLYVQSLIAAAAAETWIGFDDLNIEGTFTWVTGAPGLNGFGAGEPNNVNNEDCTVVRPDGSWNDNTCQGPKRPLCECDPAYRPPPTPACRITMPPNSFERDGRRMFRGPMATWAAAKAACEALGAHLLVIGDTDENTEVDPSLSGASFWIGLTDEATEGTFVWITGSQAPYRKWTGGTVPQNEGEDCAVIKDNGDWDDVSCASMNPYACECDPLPP